MTNETLPYFASFLISSLDLSMYELDYRNTDNTKEEHTEMLHNFEDLAQTMLRGNTAAGNFTSLLDIMKYSAVRWVVPRCISVNTNLRKS